MLNSPKNTKKRHPDDEKRRQQRKQEEIDRNLALSLQNESQANNTTPIDANVEMELAIAISREEQKPTRNSALEKVLALCDIMSINDHSLLIALSEDYDIFYSECAGTISILQNANLAKFQKAFSALPEEQQLAVTFNMCNAITNKSSINKFNLFINILQPEGLLNMVNIEENNYSGIEQPEESDDELNEAIKFSLQQPSEIEEEIKVEPKEESKKEIKKESNIGNTLVDTPIEKKVVTLPNALQKHIDRMLRLITLTFAFDHEQAEQFLALIQQHTQWNPAASMKECLECIKQQDGCITAYQKSTTHYSLDGLNDFLKPTHSNQPLITNAFNNVKVKAKTSEENEDSQTNTQKRKNENTENNNSNQAIKKAKK